MIMSDETRPSRAREAVPSAVERQIDENLKRLYQRALEDDLPDSLKDLVTKLRGEGRPK
jgi:hypothetical protein